MQTTTHSPAIARPLGLPPQRSGGYRGLCDCQQSTYSAYGRNDLQHRRTCLAASDGESLLAQNQLLASLPDDSRRHLQPHLEFVQLTAGDVLYDAGAVLSHVYFPLTAVVSLVSMMEDGGSIEVAVVGHEGVAGICAFMGGGVSLSTAVVQNSGRALRASAQVIAGASRGSAPLMQTLLSYTQALFTQMVQTSACNLHHTIDQKLCRWLLTQHDRIDGNVVMATHERIALMLGVRRESVSGAAMKLRNADLIEYRRGCIEIIDRDGLEQRSCECHRVSKRAYMRMLGSLMAQTPRANGLTPFGLANC